MGGARAGEAGNPANWPWIGGGSGAGGPTPGFPGGAEGCEEANRACDAGGAERPQTGRHGTTLVVAARTEEGLCIASVGDSRAYVLG